MKLSGKWLQSNDTELDFKEETVDFGGESYPRTNISESVCYTEGTWRGRWYYILRDDETLLVVHGDETRKATKKEDGKYELLGQELLLSKSEKKENQKIISYDDTTWECQKVNEMVTEQRFGRDGCIWYYCETEGGDLEVFSRSMVSLSYKAVRGSE